MINTKQIKINDKEYSYKFTFNAIMKFQNITRTMENPKGINLLDEKSTKDLDYTDLGILGKIAYCGIQEGMRIDKKPFKLTLEDLYNEFSDGDLLDAINSIVGIVSDITGADLPEDSKKK